MIEFICVNDAEERYEVTATARDVLLWEKTGKGRNFAKLMAELPLADLYVIAWLASKRKGLFTEPLARFEETIDLHFELDEGEPDPTQPAP